MNTSSNLDLTISDVDEKFYDHLADERERKQNYWNDFNVHREELDEILTLQSPGNTTIKKILQTK